jgi:hypothetical protein
MTSEKMNQLMLQRKEMSSWAPYLPVSLSCATSPNQPNIIQTRMAKPTSSTQGPAGTSFIRNAAPKPMNRRATDPTMGHFDGLGT